MRFLFLSLAFLSLDFHLVAQIWQQISDYPGGARDDAAHFSINGIHYVGTGRGTDFSCKGDFYAFEPMSSNWTAIAALPMWQERQYTSAFGYGGNGFVVGGENCLGNYFNTFLKYSPTTNIWTSMPDLPAAGRAGCEHFIIGSDLYLIGGRNNSGTLNEVWCFHFDTNTWEQLNNLPFNGCWRGLAVAYNNFGYLFGGRTADLNQTGWNAQTWSYEPSTDTWTTFSGFEVGEMMYQSMAQTDSLLFIFGGVDTNDQTQVDLVQINLNNLQIDTLTPFAASPRKGCVAFTSLGYFYLTTGISGNERLQETWRYAYLSNAAVESIIPFELGINFDKKQLLVTLQQPMIEAHVHILDLQGRQMFSQKCSQETLSFDLTELPTGIYFIEVGGYTKRFQWPSSI